MSDDSAGDDDDSVLTVPMQKFLDLKHDRGLPDDAECLQRIKDTMMRVARSRPSLDRGRGGRGRGPGRPRTDTQWTRTAAPGKRPLKGVGREPARDLAAACNKLSESNFEKIFSIVMNIVQGNRGDGGMLDTLFDSAVGSGSFAELYVRMFDKLKLQMPDEIKGTVTRAANRFSEAGGTVMPYVASDPDNYDDFCSHSKNRRIRLSTLGVLVRLGVEEAAEDAINAFQEHTSGKSRMVVQLDLVVDGLAEVNSLCPGMRSRVDAVAQEALGRDDVEMDARTRFKLIDVAESCMKLRRQRGARPSG